MASARCDQAEVPPPGPGGARCSAVPGAGPFARMTLGGTRSAGIPLLGMGKEAAKPLLTLHAPCIIPPRVL